MRTNLPGPDDDPRWVERPSADARAWINAATGKPAWHGRRAPPLALRPGQERVFSAERDLPLALRLSAPAGRQGAPWGAVLLAALGVGALAAIALFLAILAALSPAPERGSFAGEAPTYPSCAGCGLTGKFP